MHKFKVQSSKFKVRTRPSFATSAMEGEGIVNSPNEDQKSKYNGKPYRKIWSLRNVR